MKLRWTHRARQDLLDIGKYIAQDNPMAARRWVECLRQQARSAADAPLAGRIVPELGRKEIREVFLRNYRLVYLVQEDAILVLTRQNKRTPKLFAAVG